LAQKPETVFRARLKKRVDALPRSWWESIQQKAIKGSPDIMGCVNGHFVSLEIKRSEKAKTDKLQVYKLNKIKQAGGFAFVVYPDNFEYIFGILENLAHGLQSRETKSSK